MHYGLVLLLVLLNAQNVPDSSINAEFERTVGQDWNPQINLGDDFDLTDDKAFSNNFVNTNDWTQYDDFSETAVRETRLAEARLAQLVPSILHDVEDCRSCGKKKDFFCGKDRWAINAPDVDDGFTLGDSLKVWGCDKLPKKPIIVRNKSDGKLYVVEPHTLHETGGCNPCNGKVGNVCDKEKWVADLPHIELAYNLGEPVSSWGCKNVHNELLLVHNPKTKKAYFIEQEGDSEPLEPKKEKKKEEKKEVKQMKKEVKKEKKKVKKEKKKLKKKIKKIAKADVTAKKKKKIIKKLQKKLKKVKKVEKKIKKEEKKAEKKADAIVEDDDDEKPKKRKSRKGGMDESEKAYRAVHANLDVFYNKLKGEVKATTRNSAGDSEERRRRSGASRRQKRREKMRKAVKKAKKEVKKKEKVIQKKLKKADKKAKKKVKKLEKKLTKAVKKAKSGKLKTKKQEKKAAKVIKKLEKKVKKAAKKVTFDKKKVKKKVKRIEKKAKKELKKVAKKVQKREVKAKKLKKKIKKEKKQLKKQIKKEKKMVKKEEKKAQKKMKEIKKEAKQEEKSQEKLIKNKAVEAEKTAVKKAERKYKKKIGSKLKKNLKKILKARKCQRKTIVKLKRSGKNAKKIKKLEKKIKKEDKKMKKKVKKMQKTIKKKMKKKLKQAAKQIEKAKVKAKKADKDAKKALKKAAKAKKSKGTVVVQKVRRRRRRRYGPSKVLGQLFRKAKESIDVLHQAHLKRRGRYSKGKMKKIVKKLVKKEKGGTSKRKLKKMVKKLVKKTEKKKISGKKQIKKLVKKLAKKKNKSKRKQEKKMLKMVKKVEKKAKKAIKKAEKKATSNNQLMGLLNQDHSIDSLYKNAKRTIDALYGKMRTRKSRGSSGSKSKGGSSPKIKKPKKPSGYKKQSELKDRLKCGWQLRPGQFLKSKNKKCAMHMETKGNMVIYKGKDVVWSTNTEGKKGAHLQLKKGKLSILYKKRPVWDATCKQKAYNLVLTNSCHMVLFNKRGKPAWSTDPKFKPSKKSNKEKGRGGAQGVCKFGEPIFLESHRGKRLVDQNGKIRMHDTRKSAAHWQVLETGKKNKIFLRGYKGKHLQDGDTGVMSSKMQLGRETWSLTKIGKKWLVKSSRGKNLQDDGGVVRMQNSKKSWDRWVIRAVKGRMKCTRFKGYAREKDRIRPGSILKPGQFIKSKNKQCAMHMQKDGNLVIFKGRRAGWTSNTVGKTGAYLKVRKDGNVVVLYKGKPVWAADTKGHKVRALVLKNDCNMMLYSRSNAKVWASNRKLLVKKKTSRGGKSSKKGKGKGPGGKYTNGKGKIVGGSGNCKYGERVYLKSQRGYVLEDNSGTLSMKRNPRRQSQWQILNAGGGRVFIAGHRGQYLQDTGKRKVAVSRTQLGPETWSLTKIGKGKYVFMGRSKKNLVDDGGKVRLRKNKNEFGRWTVVSAKRGKKCEAFKGQAREQDRLRPGEQLGSRDWIKSRNSACALHMQSDGNLALYTGPFVTWASNTGGNPGAVFKVHEDGEVDITRNAKVVWKARTKGKKVRDVMLQNNCNLAMYNRRNKRVWAIHNQAKTDGAKKSKKKNRPSRKEAKKDRKVKRKVQRVQLKKEAKRILKRQKRRMKRKAKQAKKKKKKIKKKIRKLIKKKAQIAAPGAKGKLGKKLNKIAKKAKKKVKKIKKKLKKKIKKLLKKKPTRKVQRKIKRKIRQAKKKQKKVMKKESKSLKKAIKKEVKKEEKSASKPGKCGFGEPVYIISATGKSLKDGGSECTLGSSPEQWQILDAGGDKVFIARSKGKHLAYWKGKLKVSRDQLEWERWVVDPSSKPGQFTLVGKNGKALTDLRNKVGLTSKGSKWAIKRKDGKVCTRFKGNKGKAYMKKLKKKKKKIKKKLKKYKKQLKKAFNKVTKGKLSGTSPNKMRPGTRVGPGEYIASPSKKCQLRMQRDGNLVLYGGDKVNRVKWASNTYGKKGAFLRMQKDGKVVIFHKGAAVWSASNGEPGQVLTLNDDCNLVLFNKKGKSVWSSARDKRSQIYSSLSSRATATKGQLNRYARNSRQRQRLRRHARRAKAVLHELKKMATSAVTGGKTGPTSGAKANRKAKKAMKKAKKAEIKADEAEAKAETSGKKKDLKKAVKAKVKAKKMFKKAEKKSEKAAAINGRRRLIDYDSLFHELVRNSEEEEYSLSSDSSQDDSSEESLSDSSEDDSIDLTDPDAAAENDGDYVEGEELGSRLLDYLS